MCFADKREYAYWLDQSGNNNDWSSNNLTESDISVDTPTNNFATTNVLWSNSSITHSEGNLKTVTTSGEMGTTATINQSTGKWYFETLLVAESGAQALTGLSDTNNFNTSKYPGGDSYSWGIYSRAGECYYNRSNVGSLGSYTAGDIISIAYDMDEGDLWYAKNGSWLEGDPAAGTGATHTNLTGSLGPSLGSGSGAITQVLNTGQDSSFAGNETAQGNQDGNGIGDFYYTPPSGFLALCTSNLDTPAVTPSEHFNTVLYTGNNTTNAITGVGFEPGVVIFKCRSALAEYQINDVHRGVDKMLRPSSYLVEGTIAADKNVVSFDSDGFTLGEDYTSFDQVNTDTETFVAWNWLMDDTTLGTGEFTQGSIASTCNRNVDAGFSIVSWTGTGSAGTVGHGLSSTPEMILVKNKVDGYEWRVYHHKNTAAPETDYLELSTTAATVDDAGEWNDTAPSATLFTVGDADDTNKSSDAMIAYCWHSVEGYSKVGSYLGNQDADGTFVYTGFRVKMLLAKNANVVENWTIMDSARGSYNPIDIYSRPDGTAAENSGSDWVDFLSNGFKIRSNDTKINDSGETFVYLAFAETPFKYSNAR